MDESNKQILNDKELDVVQHLASSATSSTMSIYFSTFLIIIKILIITISTILNLLIIGIISFKKETRVYINYIILSICLSDFIYGIVSVAYWSAYSSSVYSNFLSYKYSCTLWAINDYSTMCINLFNTLLILFHEYKRISLASSLVKQSTNFHKLTKRRFFTLVSIWVITYSYTSILSFSMSINFDINPENCVNNYSLLMDSHLFSVPLLILFLLNVFMISFYVYSSENTLISIQANPIQVTQNSKIECNNYYIVENENDLDKNNDLSSIFRPDNDSDSLMLCEKTILKIAKLLIVLTLLWILMLPLWQISSFCVDCILYEICKIGYCIAFLCSNMNPILILIFNKKIYNEIKLIFSGSKH
jgi:hypothetical protein